MVAPALDTDVRWMRDALRLARDARAAGEVPVGAVVVGATGDVLGKGANQTEALGDPTAHAEILAIGSASYAGNYSATVTITIAVGP